MTSPQDDSPQSPTTMKPRSIPSICFLVLVCITAISIAFFVTNDLLHFHPPAPHELDVQKNTPILQRRLLFYNRPPKTGSTSIRFAMKSALDAAGLTSAKCFNRIEWNEMALRTIVNRRDIDFYGCHTRLFNWRFSIVSAMRGGNVVFMTSTRRPEDIVLSAYLQLHREDKLLAVRDERKIAAEVERYRQFVKDYPVNALYMYHGAAEPLTKCPIEWIHEESMRRVAERYEIVVDLENPEESATMVQLVTGLRPNFDTRMNERANEEGPMLRQLRNVDTSNVSCGNELVHRVLMQQFNIIKDRLMQNRCFDEDSGTYELCKIAPLRKDKLVERSRNDSIEEKIRLEEILQSKTQSHDS